MLNKIGYLLLLLCSGLFLLTGCGVHRFDDAQVPVVSVGNGQKPVISWTPTSVYRVSVYKGKKTDDNFARSVWEKRSPSYANNINSPVTLDTSLESGKTYTVEVKRKDPKGTGDGFSNTHHSYIGRKIFTVK